MFKKVINIIEILILSVLIFIIFSLIFPPDSASRTFRFYNYTKFRIVLDSLLILAFLMRIIYLIASFKTDWQQKIGRFQRGFFLIFTLGFFILLFDIGYWIWIFSNFFMPLLYLIFAIIFSLPILFWLLEISIFKKKHH
jgi:hypothetical protein